MNDPIIIQRGKRKAVIEGDRVKLLRTHRGHKDTGVWPETLVPGGEARMYAALAWVTKAYIELPGIKN